MAQPKTVRAVKDESAGDAAVDGLLAGMLAGMGMLIFLMLADLGWGATPLTTLGRFASSRNPLTGLVSHLGVSGVYGLAFALALHWFLPARLHRRLVLMASGVLFGLLLWLVAELLLLPQTASRLAEIGWPVFLVAHLLFGCLLGWRLKGADE